MAKIGRHLITTADERTWKFDRPVLFLGAWCQLYDHKTRWSNVDGKVAAPFRLETKEKLNNIDYLHILSAKILVEVTVSLNTVHNTNYSPRYWNILIGHWLKRYVDVCYNRYFTVEQALKRHKITSTTTLRGLEPSLATYDSMGFMQACDDDVWNNGLYVRVLQHLGDTDITFDSIEIKDQGSFQQERTTLMPFRWSPWKYIKSIAELFLPKLSRNKDAFISRTYMKSWNEINFYLSLWQCPQFWKSPPLLQVSSDPSVRNKFTIISKDQTGFELFVRELLPEMIPVCYLEGYALLNQQVESLNWPSEPEFIYTDNSFDTDEIFKAWVGIKTEQKIPYFVGQHGNNYGTEYGLQNWPEQMASDKFFTWGWSNDNIKNVPAFVTKITNIQLKTNPHGGLLILGLVAYGRIFMDDQYDEHTIYQEQQFRFVEALPVKIQKELTVRLHDGWIKTRWSDDLRWSDHKSSVQLDLGFGPVKKAIGKNRLIVHAYDSTGILEGLASNIPTLCFWNGGLDHLLPSAKPYYELLRSAGILADSPEHAAQLVSQYWDNIDGWWESKKVQSARSVFCEQYARVAKQPIRALSKMLRTAADNHSN